eukprot:Skav218086  [mRNA]  locus=scaffold3382:127476:129074:- [translate_table: standard]
MTLIKLAHDDSREPRHPSFLPLRLADQREGVHQFLDSVTLALHLFATFDLTSPWIGEVCLLVQSKRHVFSSEMIPHHVEIQGPTMAGIDSSSGFPRFLWAGWEAEQKPRAARQSKRQGPSKSGAAVPKEPKQKQNANKASRDAQVAQPELSHDEVKENESAQQGNAAGAASHDSDVDGYAPSLADSDEFDFDRAFEYAEEHGIQNGDDLQLDSEADEEGDWIGAAGAWLDQAEVDLLYQLDGSATNEQFDLGEHLETIEADEMGGHASSNELDLGQRCLNQDFDDAATAQTSSNNLSSEAGATAEPPCATTGDVGDPDDALLSSFIAKDSEQKVMSDKPDSDVDSDSSSSSSSSISSMSGLSDVSIDVARNVDGNVVVGSPDHSDAEGSDGQAPAPKAAPKKSSKAPRPAALERMADIRFDYSHGSVRYNIKAQNLVAHCSFHSGNCRRTRTVKESKQNRSQGRPIGLLAAWLEMAEQYETAAQHSADCRPSLERRQSARRRFEEKDGAQKFCADHERAKRDGEDDEPPSMT